MNVGDVVYKVTEKIHFLRKKELFVDDQGVTWHRYLEDPRSYLLESVTVTGIIRHVYEGIVPEYEKSDDRYFAGDDDFTDDDFNTDRHSPWYFMIEEDAEVFMASKIEAAILRDQA